MSERLENSFKEQLVDKLTGGGTIEWSDAVKRLARWVEDNDCRLTAVEGRNEQLDYPADIPEIIASKLDEAVEAVRNHRFDSCVPATHRNNECVAYELGRSDAIAAIERLKGKEDDPAIAKLAYESAQKMIADSKVPIHKPSGEGERDDG